MGEGFFTTTRRLRADDQSADTFRAQGPEAEIEDACDGSMSPETRRLHAGLYFNTKEAELCDA